LETSQVSDTNNEIATHLAPEPASERALSVDIEPVGPSATSDASWNARPSRQARQRFFTFFRWRSPGCPRGKSTKDGVRLICRPRNPPDYPCNPRGSGRTIRSSSCLTVTTSVRPGSSIENELAGVLSEYVFSTRGSPSRGSLRADRMSWAAS